MIERYKIYLAYINTKLEKFFKQQKSFIFCKKGCSKCCKNTEIPISLLELKFLLLGFLQLPVEVQNSVEKNIEFLYEKKKSFNEEEKFLYDCPFLIDDVCCVYEYRSVICRAFGIMTQDNENNKIKAPFCYELGLNYSNVLDKDGKLSQEKINQGHFEDEPIAYNVSYKFLTSDAFEKDFGITFGEKKPLLNWFIEDKLAQEEKEDKISAT